MKMRTPRRSLLVVANLSLLVVLSTLLARRHLAPHAVLPIETPVHLYRMEDEEWTAITSEGESYVNSTIPTVVLFVDYECRFCAEAERWLDSVAAEWDGPLSVLRRHRPLDVFPASRFEAEVAACLKEVAREEDMVRLYEASFSSRAHLPRTIDRSVGERLESGSGRIVVEGDLALADRLGIKRVPTFALNQYWLSSPPSPREMRRLMQDIRAGRKPGDASARTDIAGINP
jgi:hypothetical protein